jgi:hypothetical protein
MRFGEKMISVLPEGRAYMGQERKQEGSQKLRGHSRQARQQE